tara:strand:- start:7235 stop:7654 length:420 start_codon:yes stop_codon:yes gene_type:complete
MTKISKLAQLKLEVINYHTTDKPSADGPIINDKFLISLAGDACYTSNNSLSYKKKQLADSRAEYDRHVDENNIYSAEKTERWIDLLTPELDELQTRHDADIEVFAIITHGEVWQYKPKANKSAKAFTPRDFTALDKRVA